MMMWAFSLTYSRVLAGRRPRSRRRLSSPIRTGGSTTDRKYTRSSDLVEPPVVRHDDVGFFADVQPRACGQETAVTEAVEFPYQNGRIHHRSEVHTLFRSCRAAGGKA